VSAGKRLALAASAVMLAAVGAGLWINGAPGEHRERRIDDRRAEALQAISIAIDAHYLAEGGLPPTLASLGLPASLHRRLPEGEAVDYRVLDERRYELCLAFAHAGDGPGRWHAGGMRHDWAHAAGRHCFTRVVDETRSDDEG